MNYKTKAFRLKLLYSLKKPEPALYYSITLMTSYYTGVQSMANLNQTKWQ